MSFLADHVNCIQQILQFKDQNLCYSPFSLYYSLAILAECSDDASIQQLCEKLKLDKEQIHKLVTTLSQDQTVKCAANIFTKNLTGMKDEFKQTMQSKYGFEPEKFVSVQQVNKWCADHTNDRIKEILQSDEHDTIILSAIHFMDDWSKEFDEIPHYPDQFTTFSGTKVDKKMIQTERDMMYLETNTFQSVRLQYKTSKLQAIVVLPKQPGKDAFNINFADLFNRPQRTKVNVVMPEFKIESTLGLNETLKKLGVNQIFERIDCTKTLSDVLKVDSVVQKTFIKVDKKGTEAAAATGIMMLRMCMAAPPQTKDLICDRPFWFLLAYQNEIIFVSSIIE